MISVQNEMNESFYKNRDGSLVPIPVSNNALIEKMFAHSFTRAVMRFVSSAWYANLQRAVMSSFFSSFFITKFVRKNGIRLSEYQKKKYTSFHDFFKREIRPEKRPFTVCEDDLLSPCDCKASVYEISENACFSIKGVPYTVDEVLDDFEIARSYEGGYMYLLRLSLDDYHHYMYPVSGEKSADVVIPGKLYTVHPLIHKYSAVYRENAREFCEITMPDGSRVIVMQVGALGVGKIANDHTDARTVSQGEEQGHFEFGGSTILVLTSKGSFKPSDDLLANTEEGFETVIKMGERIGSR
ncbi:MAG: phosphatidylserine decarboxylase [Lachnospiraceae bacterium]|nr:phosphatidylserine decarboxylase [Lachnospiraceae bacterium]